jgi:hypothetical protein
MYTEAERLNPLDALAPDVITRAETAERVSNNGHSVTPPQSAGRARPTRR